MESASLLVQLGAYIAYKGLRGFSDQVTPTVTDAAFDVAFNDPQADRSILGTDLTPSMYLGVRGPGMIGSFSRARNAARFGVGAETNPVTSGMYTGAFGAAAGAYVGAKRGGRIGGIRGGIIGGISGAAIGAGASMASAINTASVNRQIISESPFYNHSALTAQRLNASGNIVLGMHNQRRG